MRQAEMTVSVGRKKCLSQTVSTGQEPAYHDGC